MATFVLVHGAWAGGCGMDPALADLLIARARGELVDILEESCLKRRAKRA